MQEIEITWVRGVAGKDVSDKDLPGGSADKGISRGNDGSWRAHMDALQQWVFFGITV